MSSIIKSDMDDDIESLLKELELEQDTLPTSYKKKAYNINSEIPKYNYESKKSISNENNISTNELNDILQELSMIDSPTIPKNNKFNSKPNKAYIPDKNDSNSNVKPSYNNNLSSSLTTNNNTTSYRKAKCTTVCIGGPEGITIGNKQKSCNKLRCTSCDFNCMYFKNYEWSNNVDYLFFRNHVPNTDKLSKELIPKKRIYRNMLSMYVVFN